MFVFPKIEDIFWEIQSSGSSICKSVSMESILFIIILPFQDWSSDGLKLEIEDITINRQSIEGRGAV